MSSEALKLFLEEWEAFKSRHGCTIATFRGETCAYFKSCDCINLEVLDGMRCASIPITVRPNSSACRSA